MLKIITVSTYYVPILGSVYALIHSILPSTLCFRYYLYIFHLMNEVIRQLKYLLKVIQLDKAKPRFEPR